MPTHTDFKSPPRIGLVGFGTIGRAIVRLWSSLDAAHFDPMTAVCLRPEQQTDADRLLHPNTRQVTSIQAMIDMSLDTIIEAAGHEFIVKHGEHVMSSGANLLILSVGALAVGDTLEALQRAATLRRNRLIVPSGALAGFDGLRAMARTGRLHTVTFTSTKPPKAWRNTPAEARLDLDELRDPVTFFDGSAREAAQQYPKNANLAAAVGLAGIGLDRTRVRLIADPDALGNRATVQAESEVGTLDLTLAGAASGQNPKTSEITAYSVVAALSNWMSHCTFW